jgi:hypothetical protein
MVGSFEHSGIQLAGVAQQQNSLATAVASGDARAGQEYIDTMTSAQQVFKNMAATYRAAGRSVAEADAANERMFRGRSE